MKLMGYLDHTISPLEVSLESDGVADGLEIEGLRERGETSDIHDFSPMDPIAP